MNQWISVDERLPQPDSRVLVVAGGIVSFGTLWTKWGWKLNCSVGREHQNAHITHWMPLPAPPEATNQKG